MKKKIVSVLLTACMLLTLIPAVALTASAAFISTCYIDANDNGTFDGNEVDYSSISAAIADVGTTPSTIRLVADVTDNVEIASGKTITIDLNGNTLRSNGTAETRHNAINNFGTLTVVDSSTDGSGIITGGTGSVKTKSSCGGGVYNRGGAFTMLGGTISGNSATLGGGVANMGSGTFTMLGGTISGNTAKTSGGGVFNEGTVIIGGTAKIQDNILSTGSVTNNLFLNNSTVTIATDENALKSGASVGITLSSGYGRFTQNGTVAEKQYFFSDSDTYFVKYHSDEYLELAEPVGTITYMVGGVATVISGAPTKYGDEGITAEKLKTVVPNTPDGMKFKGWFDDATGGTKVTSIEAGTNGDKILYARFASATDVTLTPVARGGYTSEDEGVTKTPIVAFGATFGEYATKDVQKYGFFIYNVNTDLDSAKRAECSVTLTGALAIREGRFFATASEVGTTDTYYAKAFVVIDGEYYFSSLVSAVGNKDTWLTIDQNAS